MAINVEIQGVRYFSTSEIMKEVGVSRQTLWRWRQEGKIPLGHRFRDGRILFTSSEIDSIRQFANRIESPDVSTLNQLLLFTQKS
jgi:predicted DNA-binding transcriptional regulator AlpA